MGAVKSCDSKLKSSTCMPEHSTAALSLAHAWTAARHPVTAFAALCCSAGVASAACMGFSRGVLRGPVWYLRVPAVTHRKDMPSCHEQNASSTSARFSRIWPSSLSSCMPCAFCRPPGRAFLQASSLPLAVPRERAGSLCSPATMHVSRYSTSVPAKAAECRLVQHARLLAISQASQLRDPRACAVDDRSRDIAHRCCRMHERVW